MDLGGSVVMFVLALLSTLASLAKCYGYYRVVPRVKFIVDTKEYANVYGDYVDYGNNIDLYTKLLVLVEDPLFGCSNANDTAHPSYADDSVFLLPKAKDGQCSDYDRTRFTKVEYDASGVIFYTTSGGNSGPPPTDGGRNVKRRHARTQSSRGYLPTVVSLDLLSTQLADLKSKLSTGSTVQVTIEARYQQGFKTSQTFYFVVFAFCILMLLSCLWFLMSYFKRCHYRWRARRNRLRSANETRQLVNRLPTKSYKTSKEKGEIPTCVVCLEAFKNNDSIRILPCKHEFHKKCIDPWLKIKRNCPMCKQDAFPPNKRTQSTSSRSDGSNTDTGRRNETRATQQHVAVLTLSVGERDRSWTNSSSSSDSDDNSSSIVGSSDAASNSTQETEASLVDDSGSGDGVNGDVVLRVVSPLVSSEQAPQQLEDNGGTAESSSEGREQREERENSLESSTSSEQVSVDIEGVNLLQPSSVVHA